MKKTIITISREYGTGGRDIGKAVADELGIKFYDREIITQIAAETGFTEEFVEKHGETAPGNTGLIYAMISRTASGVSLDDLVYRAQHDVITKLANDGPCVIVGRAADYVLRDREDVLHIFITGAAPDRIQRVIGYEDINEKAAAQRIKEIDKKRAVHYQYYTDRKWGDIHNYDMVLNSSTLGTEKCVQYIIDVASQE